MMSLTSSRSIRSCIRFVAAAIGIVTERIKKEIYRGKNKFLHSVAAEGAQNISQILRRLKQNGVGGRKAKNHQSAPASPFGLR